MFFNGLLPHEIPIMENFIKYKVHYIVSVIYKEFNGFIPRIEAPYVIRYFLKFPSNSQMVDEVLVEIEKLESSADKSKELLEVDAVETYLIQLLKTNKYSSYDKETLIEAFRILDKEGDGYLDLHTYYAFLKRYGTAFTKEQIDEMEKFLLDNETELLKPLGVSGDDAIKHDMTKNRIFYYESYVRKVLSDNQKHYEEIMKDYKDYYNEFQETKKFRDLPQIVTVQEIKPEPTSEKKPEENKAQEGAPAEGQQPPAEGGEGEKPKEEAKVEK